MGAKRDWEAGAKNVGRWARAKAVCVKVWALCVKVWAYKWAKALCCVVLMTVGHFVHI